MADKMPVSPKKKINNTLSSGNKTENALELQMVKYLIQIFFTGLFYLIVIAGVSELANAAYDFMYPIFGHVSMEEVPGENIKVEIKEGESMQSIANKLYKKGLIENPYNFYIRGKLSVNKKRTIKAGVYTLNTSNDYGELLNILTGSDEVTE